MSLWRRLTGGNSATPRGRLGRVLLLVLGGFLLLVLIGRLAGPSIIARVVEKSLENMPGGYQGTLERVDLRMLDAEVALVGLKIVKKNGRVPVPFLETRELVIGTVRDGSKPRTTLRLAGPVMSYVDAESEALKQTGPNIDLAQIRKQLPFELMAVYIEDGQVHFRNFQTKPDIDAYLTDLEVTWDGLVGCMPPGNASCRSELRGKATLMQSGHVGIRGRFDRTPEVRFDARVTVRDLKAAQLNAVLKHYAKVSVQKGEVDLDATLRRHGERQEALIVPGLADFEVVGGDEKDTRFFRELGLAAAAGYFERKRGKKAIALTKKPNGESEFELVDLKDASADSKDR